MSTSLSSTSSSSSSQILAPINDQHGSEIYKSCIKEFEESFALLKEYYSIEKKTDGSNQLEFAITSVFLQDDPLARRINEFVGKIFAWPSLRADLFRIIGVILQMRAQLFPSPQSQEHTTLLCGSERLGLIYKNDSENFEISFVLSNPRLQRKLSLSLTRMRPPIESNSLDPVSNLSLKMDHQEHTAINAEEAYLLCRHFLYMVDKDDHDNQIYNQMYNQISKAAVNAAIITVTLRPIVFDYLALADSPFVSSLHPQTPLKPGGYFACFNCFAQIFQVSRPN